MTGSAAATQLIGLPLATWERDGLKAALAKVGLPVDDVDEPDRLFWRFERDDIPVGFGGLEVHGKDALLRSVVTLPPVRRTGIARAIVAALETEATIAGCRAIWLLTTTSADVFARLGYGGCDRAEVPEPIRATRQFAALCPASATAMVKRLA